MSTTTFIAMLRACCRAVHNGNPPTFGYADRAASLMFMTAAHESDGFRARRQYGFSAGTTRGAFSLFQMEFPSIRESLAMIKARPVLHGQATAFLTAIDSPVEFDDPFRVLQAIQKPTGDALAAVLARLHYYRVPAPVPETPMEQAQYAKKYWNTYLGKATPEDYLCAAYKALWKA